MITITWLKSIGFKQHSRESHGWMSIPAGRGKQLVIRPRGRCRAIVEFHDDSIMLQTQIVRLPYVTTRREVRQLCAVLIEKAKVS